MIETGSRITRGTDATEERKHKMRDANHKRTVDGMRMGAAALLALGLVLGGCGKKEEEKAGSAPKTEESGAEPAAGDASKGVGPVSSVEIGPLDETLAAKGQAFFSGTCAACHKLDQRYVGPALAGVTKRRSPEWIMNMILNPTGMTQSDPTAKALLGEYMTQMSVTATQDDARAVLEFFRKNDGN
jgi:mono/diheme cytochrome c family protein